MSVHTIISKYNLKPVKSFESVGNLTPNNRSKKEFLKYCSMFGLTQIGKTNSYSDDGYIIAFSMCRTYEPECRQFAKHYDKLTCLFPNGEYKTFNKSELNIGKVTRIGPDGVEYHNVKGLKLMN